MRRQLRRGDSGRPRQKGRTEPLVTASLSSREWMRRVGNVHFIDERKNGDSIGGEGNGCSAYNAPSRVQ